ncbi:Os11g0600301 [Oryza sativa Japonica Group]|uniref:Os11g0600301 protein n=1 Tax=Oryza sativa subsp. japonica TaxID=39947 RepID=A0A0P0Y479_ORYSJ|nr:hypothetical protein EE612_056523 [Oryza sativa]KAF2911554.1 hypothetical protein DAI22_11g188700 [Oryza sativa Japonica Group]BAT14748.1 Os11g0600301 [Oryza sativa Japonica Group]
MMKIIDEGSVIKLFTDKLDVTNSPICPNSETVSLEGVRNYCMGLISSSAHSCLLLSSISPSIQLKGEEPTRKSPDDR